MPSILSFQSSAGQTKKITFSCACKKNHIFPQSCHFKQKRSFITLNKCNHWFFSFFHMQTDSRQSHLHTQQHRNCIVHTKHMQHGKYVHLAQTLCTLFCFQLDSPQVIPLSILLYCIYPIYFIYLSFFLSHFSIFYFMVLFMLQTHLFAYFCFKIIQFTFIG